MKKTVIILLFLSSLTNDILAQKNIRTFIFGHSLINHEFQVNPTPSQETSVPHWFHFLAAEGGHQYAMSGQYGFLPQHANLPPIAQWGFDVVTGAWDSDNEPFSAADFSSILITPGNFIQWQGPTVNYPTDNTSPLAATRTIFDWCMQQEDGLNFYIYENWPDMGPYLNNNFPPSSSEWANYNEYLLGDFHDWFLDYHDLLRTNFPNACIRMIPVGPIISRLLSQAPYNQIPIDELYEDDAPHGRPNIYFLAALTTYMAMVEEKAAPDFQVASIIHPIIADNYQAVVDFIWKELMDFTDDNGQSKVFCSPLTTSNQLVNKHSVSITPNPSSGYLQINNLLEDHRIDIFSMEGKIIFSNLAITSQNSRINLSSLPQGMYILVGKNQLDQKLYSKKIIKY